MFFFFVMVSFLFVFREKGDELSYIIPLCRVGYVGEGRLICFFLLLLVVLDVHVWLLVAFGVAGRKEEIEENFQGVHVVVLATESD